MIRNSFSLPFRLLQDVAPAQRQLSSPNFPVLTASSTWRRQHPQQRSQLGPDHETRSFSSTQGLEMKRRGIPPRPVPRPKKKKRYPTPTAKRVAEARTRKNIARQTVLKEERAIAFGDTVWGAREPTEFVKSFESATDELPTADKTNSGAMSSFEPGTPSTFSTIVAAAREAAAQGKRAPLLNDFIRADELQANLELSRRLTEPVEEQRTGANDPTANAARRERHEREHEIASEAVSRILAVSQAKSKGRKHVNIQRCIEKLGRHNTDGVLLGIAPGDVGEHDVKQRIGPDTGSSEVQIALLTLKIRKLAHEREGPLRRDKINKRNLRVLLHRRQKMMRYFWKKNRGGPRWQNLIDTLGLTDANWKGEIILP